MLQGVSGARRGGRFLPCGVFARDKRPCHLLSVGGALWSSHHHHPAPRLCHPDLASGFPSPSRDRLRKPPCARRAEQPSADLKREGRSGKELDTQGTRHTLSLSVKQTSVCGVARNSTHKELDTRSACLPNTGLRSSLVMGTVNSSLSASPRQRLGSSWSLTVGWTNGHP